MKALLAPGQKINELTLEIEREYPELYQYLDKKPITIPRCENLELYTRNFPD